VKPAFDKFGLYGGLAYTGLFYIVGRGKEPWTFKHAVRKVINFIHTGTRTGTRQDFSNENQLKPLFRTVF
jgi:hypothetical protein